jgi:hypothetical protein
MFAIKSRTRVTILKIGAFTTTYRCTTTLLRRRLIVFSRTWLILVTDNGTTTRHKFHVDIGPGAGAKNIKYTLTLTLIVFLIGPGLFHHRRSSVSFHPSVPLSVSRLSRRRTATTTMVTIMDDDYN